MAADKSMTPTSEQSVQKQSASEEERAKGGSAFEREWRNHPDERGAFKRDARRWFHIGEKSLQSRWDSEIHSLRLTNQRLEAEVENMKKEIGVAADLLAPHVCGSDHFDSDVYRLLRDLESQKGQL